MEISTDYEEYIQDYIRFQFISDNGLSVLYIGYFAKVKGSEDEVHVCTYNPEDDEYYHEGKVTLVYHHVSGNPDNDIMILFEKPFFFEHILKVCQEHIATHPEDRKRLMGYLTVIKNDLGI